MKTRGLSVKGKINGLVILVLILMAFSISIMSYLRIKSYLLTDVRDNSQNLAKSIASNIDGDAMAEIKEGDDESEAYQNAVLDLRKYIDIDSITYVYTMYVDDNGDMRFKVDADEEDPAGIDELYEDAVDEMFEAYEGKVTSDSEPTTDEWGTYISAYAPFYNSKAKLPE